jgi:hypothetical protein
MNTIWRGTGWAVGVSVVALGIATPGVLAQKSKGTSMSSGSWCFQMQPSRTITQAVYNIPPLGQAYVNVPPFATVYSPSGTRAVAIATTPYAGPFANSSAGYAGLSANPYAATLTSTALTNNPGYGTGNLYSDPYSGYGGYPYYGESQLGGYVRGVADVVGAVGRQMVDEQRARLIRQQVKQEQLETWKRGFDYWLYYRDRMPTAEDDRERAVQLQVRRSLNDPPVGEIYSGQSLNTLLDDLKKKLIRESDFQRTPLAVDEETLGHLNLTPTQDSGNPGLLKKEGRLTWPQALRSQQFQEERATLDHLSPAVYEQVLGNRVDPGALDAMSAAVQGLQQRLTDHIRDLTPTQYGEARRFLRDFNDAITLLKRPNSGAYFSNKAIQGKNLGQLVQHMLDKGLRFAPALPGDEPAYLAAHRGLVVYALTANSQMVAERTENEK